jgi:hypothetical protein
LVIDTVVCLTLDKWETVSGQFGGYLTRGHCTPALVSSSGWALTMSYSATPAS